MTTACLDASFIGALLLPEEESDAAWALFRQWRDEAVELVAPNLMPFEVSSILRLAVSTGRVTEEEGDTAFIAFRQFPVRLLAPEDLLDRAWRLGKVFKPTRLYDMAYVALAEASDCPLWTIDKRLAGLLQGRFPLLRLVTPA